MMDVVERLSHVKQNGSGWTARCPSHEDKENSLSVKHENGKWLLKCHAGCTVDSITNAMGVDIADLFDDRRLRDQGKGGLTLDDYARAKKLPVDFLREQGISEIFYQGKPAVRFPHTAPNGVLLSTHFRISMSGDRFRWKSGDKAVLYGQSRLEEARRAGQIVIVEGETDCLTLWLHGFPAIGLPGAGNWKEERDVHLLDGIDDILVVVEPDRGGETVKEWLSRSSIRPRVRLLSLPVKDPNEFYLQDPANFAERWRNACREAQPWIETAKPKGHDPQPAEAVAEQLYALTSWNPWQRSGGPAFPLSTLPGLAQEWVATKAMQTGADMSAFAMAFLHIVSGCVDHRITVRPKLRERDFRITPNIWTMLVGPSSTMKTPVVKSVTTALRRFDKLDAAARADAVRMASAGGDDKAMKKAEKSIKPSRRRLLVDTTIEAVSEILSHQDCGTTLVRDELAGWLDNMDRYAKGSDRPFWLEAQNGGYYIVDRMKGRREVNVLSVGIFGGIQPARVKNLADLTSDGLFQRFSPVNMPFAGEETDEEGSDAAFLRFDGFVTDIGRIPPTELMFCEEAAALYVKFSNEMRVASRITTPSEAFGTYLGKQARTLAAIALLLHIADLAQSLDGYPPVPVETFLRAQRIVERFILPHAELFYSTTVDSFGKTQSVAGAILRMAKEGVIETTSRELGRRSGPIRELQSDHLKIRAALTPFVINGWLTPASMLPNNVGWLINPALAGRFEAELHAQERIRADLLCRMGKTDDEDGENGQ